LYHNTSNKTQLKKSSDFFPYKELYGWKFLFQKFSKKHPPCNKETNLNMYNQPTNQPTSHIDPTDSKLGSQTLGVNTKVPACVGGKM